MKGFKSDSLETSQLEREFGQRIREIVVECTDDKSKPWMERKQLQITETPTKSRDAKLVEMADKIYNLRDLQRATPKGWTLERVQTYFHWAKQVTEGCRGVNDFLERQLDAIYDAGQFDFEGRLYPCTLSSSQ